MRVAPVVVIMACVPALWLSGCKDGGASREPVLEAAEAVQGAVTGVTAPEGDGMAANVEFPVDFIGHWDVSDAACARPDSSSRYLVSERAIQGPTGVLSLRAIESPNDLTAFVRVVQSLDRQVVERRWSLYLSPVAAMKLRIETEEQTVLAVRCDPV